MKKLLASILCGALAVTAAFAVVGCADDSGNTNASGDSASSAPEVVKPTHIDGFSIGVDGVIDFEEELGESYALYRGENKLVEVRAGDDISALVTTAKETYTVRGENAVSDGVKAYKKEGVADLAIHGTTVTFTAGTEAYKLLVNGVDKGAVESGDDISAYLSEGACEIRVFSEGSVEGDVVRLHALSNAVSVNEKGDNDVEYDEDWLKYWEEN